jgi:hypothetical protein
MTAEYWSPTAADELTEEIIDAAYEIGEGWYPDTRIDWDDLIDRLDRQGIERDGKELDLGEDMLSPFIVKLKREVNKRRR